MCLQIVGNMLTTMKNQVIGVIDNIDYIDNQARISYRASLTLEPFQVWVPACLIEVA